jgi:arginyl-tRNA synthetase
MIADDVRAAIKNAAAAADLPVGDHDIVLEHPALDEHGDFATNIALTFAKKLRRPPMEIAGEIARNIAGPDILKAEAAAPGFVNIWLSDAYLCRETTRSISEGIRYGTAQRKNQRVLIEHTQVNPNKEPHIGHLRNACIGDALVRLYRSAGYDAKALYYHNDVGQQIASILLAEQKGYVDRAEFGSTISWASAAYVDIDARMETDEDLRNEKEKVQISIAAQNTPEAQRAKTLTLAILRETLEVLAQLHISYDLIVRESDILKGKLWEKTFDLLKKKPAFYEVKDGEKKGCWVITMPNAEDKIIVRSNGVPTYTGNDIANHLWKFGILPDFCYRRIDWGTQPRPLYMTTSEEDGTSGSNHAETRNDFTHADTIVNVIDQTQTYPQESVVESLRALGFNREADHYRHVNYGFVFLSSKTARQLGVPVEAGKDRVKISGRKGTTISIAGFLGKMEETLRANYGESGSLAAVASGAIKFELLKYNTYQDVVFDLDAALDIHGMSGPYLQYAAARAKSIIAKTPGRAGEPQRSRTDDLPNAERVLLRKLVRFPEAVSAALTDHAPHTLCLYLFELAQEWNSFYNEHRIIGSERETELLTLVRAVAQVLENGLGLLGIDAPEKM